MSSADVLTEAPSLENITPARALTVAVFADVNPNLIDGSTIWLQSICLCVLKLSNVRVIVMLREPLTSELIVAPILQAGGELCCVPERLRRDGPPAKCEPRDLEEVCEQLDATSTVDLFIVRGEAHIARLAKNDRLRMKVWAYWLRRPRLLSPWEDVAALEAAQCVNRLVVQSPHTKAVFESLYNVPAAKVVVIPPMVPAEAWRTTEVPEQRRGLVYSGKLDKAYNVEFFLQIPTQFRSHGRVENVVFVGDKFNRAAGDADFVARMRRGLESSEGVVWQQGVGRAEALRIMSRGRFGLCWRDKAYENSLELSTKLLEFCALAVPPLVNRTAIHRSLLGDDYPYYVDGIADILGAVLRAERDPDEYVAVSRRIRGVARAFSFESASRVIAEELKIAGIDRPRCAGGGEKPVRVLVAAHDTKFLDAVLERLDGDPRFERRLDRWLSTENHVVSRSEQLLEWADVVFCEWCAGAAIWYSNRVRDGQKCFVRLHRFEAFTEAPRHVNFAKVDQLIVVSAYFRDLCASQFNAPLEKIAVLPQYVDWRQFHRPKHAWADFTLGLVGINSFPQKRFDRAVDILAELRGRDDPRWRLRIRSVMPWDLKWVWERDSERAGFTRQFNRIWSDPGLRDHILFDPPGADMAEWYRHVGFILSTSDSEGCHTSVAEGMASGCIPVIYPWPGADSVYPAGYVAQSVPDMVERLRAFQSNGRVEGERVRASELAKSYDVTITQAHLEKLLLSGLRDSAAQ